MAKVDRARQCRLNDWHAWPVPRGQFPVISASCGITTILKRRWQASRRSGRRGRTEEIDDRGEKRSSQAHYLHHSFGRINMQELTLESLARRLEEVERRLNERQAAVMAPTKDWRSVAGIS